MATLNAGQGSQNNVGGGGVLEGDGEGQGSAEGGLRACGSSG